MIKERAKDPGIRLREGGGACSKKVGVTQERKGKK